MRGRGVTLVFSRTEIAFFALGVEVSSCRWRETDALQLFRRGSCQRRRFPFCSQHVRIIYIYTFVHTGTLLAFGGLWRFCVSVPHAASCAPGLLQRNLPSFSSVATTATPSPLHPRSSTGAASYLSRPHLLSLRPLCSRVNEQGRRHRQQRPGLRHQHHQVTRAASARGLIHRMPMHCSGLTETTSLLCTMQLRWREAAAASRTLCLTLAAGCSQDGAGQGAARAD